MKTSKLPGRLPVRPSVSISTFTYITDLYYYNLPPALAASAPHWHTRNTRSSASIPLPAHKKGGMEKTNLSLPATPIILNSAQSLAASTHRPLPVPPRPFVKTQMYPSPSSPNPTNGSQERPSSAPARMHSPSLSTRDNHTVLALNQ